MIMAVDKKNGDRAGVSDNPKDVVVFELMILNLVDTDESASFLMDVDGW